MEAQSRRRELGAEGRPEEAVIRSVLEVCRRGEAAANGAGGST